MSLFLYGPEPTNLVVPVNHEFGTLQGDYYKSAVYLSIFISLRARSLWRQAILLYV